MDRKGRVRDNMASIIVCAYCTARDCHNCKVEWIDYARPFGTIVKGVTV